MENQMENQILNIDDRVWVVHPKLKTIMEGRVVELEQHLLGHYTYTILERNNKVLTFFGRNYNKTFFKDKTLAELRLKEIKNPKHTFKIKQSTIIYINDIIAKNTISDQATLIQLLKEIIDENLS